MKKLISNYTFSAVGKTVTFTDYTSIQLANILLITNTTDNVIIYNFSAPAKGGTVSNNVLTLTYDTSSMADSDKLQIYYDEEIDAKVLFSGTLTTAGAQTAIDTTGCSSIVAQFSGSWEGEIHCEVSNDGTTYYDTSFLSSNDISIQDFVTINGIYSIQTSAKYVRPNVSWISGTINITIVGRVGEERHGANLLTLALDKTNRTPLQVQLPLDIKQTPDGRIVFADMDGPYAWNSPDANSSKIIDCTGYQTMIVQKNTAGIVTPTVSNDNIVYSATVAYAQASATAGAATIPTALGIYIIPINSRYIKLTGPATAVSCVIYLSAQPFNPFSAMAVPTVGVSNTVAMNISQINSTTMGTGGTTSSFAIGGTQATNVVPTANPVIIGGVEDQGLAYVNRPLLTKRLLTDTEGRLQIGRSQDGENIQLVMDHTRDGNYHMIEYLKFILIEQRITNQLLYELPNALIKNISYGDDLEVMRQDNSEDLAKLI